MTKDLALIVGGDQAFLETEAFLERINVRLGAAMASG